MDKKLEAFANVLKTMDDLRSKCPWDKKQTNETLRSLTIEEGYELSDAVLQNSGDEICQELGDILLHIVFYSKIGEEKKQFDIADVCNRLVQKLVTRHPHVYGNVKVENELDVKDNWEKIKLENGAKSALAGVPESLPSMIKAFRMQDKARGVGFDWDKKEQVWDKVREEFSELEAEIEAMDADRMEAEFGDLFFSLINAARLYHINPDNALERTNRTFRRRFNYLEAQTLGEGRSLRNMSLEEMEVIWQAAKAKGL